PPRIALAFQPGGQLDGGDLVVRLGLDTTCHWTPPVEGTIPADLSPSSATILPADSVIASPSLRGQVSNRAGGGGDESRRRGSYRFFLPAGLTFAFCIFFCRCGNLVAGRRVPGFWLLDMRRLLSESSVI